MGGWWGWGRGWPGAGGWTGLPRRCVWRFGSAARTLGARECRRRAGAQRGRARGLLGGPHLTISSSASRISGKRMQGSSCSRSCKGQPPSHRPRQQSACTPDPVLLCQLPKHPRFLCKPQQANAWRPQAACCHPVPAPLHLPSRQARCRAPACKGTSSRACLHGVAGRDVVCHLMAIPRPFHRRIKHRLLRAVLQHQCRGGGWGATGTEDLTDATRAYLGPAGNAAQSVAPTRHSCGSGHGDRPGRHPPAACPVRSGSHRPYNLRDVQRGAAPRRRAVLCGSTAHRPLPPPTPGMRAARARRAPATRSRGCRLRTRC